MNKNIIVQYLKSMTAIIASSCLLFACSGNSSSSKDNNPKPADAISSETSSPTNASFSATIDGTPVSGDQIDDLQMQNTAFIYPPTDNNPQGVLFFLYTTKKGDDFSYLRFSVPDIEGEYHATNGTYDQTHTSVILDFNLKSSNNFARYDEDSVTVIINKITSSRILGTFSGGSD